MSRFFDALKKSSELHLLDEPKKETPSAQIKTTPEPASKTGRYVSGGLLLLTGLTGWIVYEQSHYLPAITPEAPVSVVPIPVAASGVQDTRAAPAAEPPKNNCWTSPLPPRKLPAKKRTAHQKPVKQKDNPDPLLIGYRALIQGQLDLAEKYYLLALEKHPHEKDALLGMAVISQRKKKFDRAGDYYRQVLREDLGNATAAAGLVSLSMLADLPSAESQLRELIDLKPSAPEFHYALGNVFARQLRLGEALQSFSRALELAPDRALYAYNLAVTLDRLHQPNAARPHYEQAAKLANDPTLNLDAISLRIQQLNSRP